MSSRLQRLWHPGDPRVRVFLPDFWLKLIESPKKGYKRQPKNVATFEVDPRMSIHDVREYLEKIYKLPVRAVSTMNVMGRITWDFPLDRFKRTALWKEEDKKIAFVYFKKGFEAEYPDLFVDSEMKREDDEMESRMSRINEGDRNEQNRKYLNKDRAGVGEFLPL